MPQTTVRLAWATDLHLDFVGDEQVAAFCGAVLAQRVGGLLLGGDTAQAPSLARWLTYFRRELDLPVYVVAGNHDYYRGSVSGVGRKLAALAAADAGLHWLEGEAGPRTLGPGLALVGHGCWGDTRLGDFARSPLMLNDFLLIDELTGLDRATLRQRLSSFGRQAAEQLARQCRLAAADHDQVLVLTHVPPFLGACWHQGQLASADYLPFFACGAAGEALLEVAAAHPATRFLVLSGHTHSAGEYRPLDNLLVRTGGASYGKPQPQETIELVLAAT